CSTWDSGLFTHFF
nr:immunoglobulin light chain junction region [Macaca mulatta]